MAETKASGREFRPAPPRPGSPHLTSEEVAEVHRDKPNPHPWATRRGHQGRPKHRFQSHSETFQKNGQEATKGNGSHTTCPSDVMKTLLCDSVCLGRRFGTGLKMSSNLKTKKTQNLFLTCQAGGNATGSCRPAQPPHSQSPWSKWFLQIQGEVAKFKDIYVC